MTVQSGMDSVGKSLPIKEVRSYWPLYTVRVSKPRKLCDGELITTKTNIYMNI